MIAYLFGWLSLQRPEELSVKQKNFLKLYMLLLKAVVDKNKQHITYYYSDDFSFTNFLNHVRNKNNLLIADDYNTLSKFNRYLKTFCPAETINSLLDINTFMQSENNNLSKFACLYNHHWDRLFGKNYPQHIPSREIYGAPLQGSHDQQCTQVTHTATLPTYYINQLQQMSLLSQQTTYSLNQQQPPNYGAIFSCYQSQKQERASQINNNALSGCERITIANLIN